MFKAKKIWYGDVNAVDYYVDFTGNFNWRSDSKKAFMRIVCDGAFAVVLNSGKTFFGSCADFPDRKRYYRFNLTPYLTENNSFTITVWHVGADSQTYIKAPAFLAFDIISGGKVIYTSGKHVLCRKNPHYVSGYKKLITVQLGLGFLYDNNANDDGIFRESEEYGFIEAEKHGCASLKILSAPKFKLKKTESGYLVDLLKETVGFLEIDVDSPAKQEIVIAYGEHLVEGRVPRNIDGRDFSVGIILRQGRNKILAPFRRIAGRYLEIFAENLTVFRAVIRPVVYPVSEKKVVIKDDLIKKIYDTCVYTLKCCMHEHYEDCPWREQALYTMDSRNQMLCGYYAFNGYFFQRENLILISQGLRSDGLLSLCFPAGIDKPIPFFTLVYPIQVYEYIKYSGDKTILKEVEYTLRVNKKVFDGKVDENGLIEAFGGDYWNFYEWTEGSDHGLDSDADVKGRYDLILNCMYVYASGYYDRLLGTDTDLSKTKDAILKYFYVNNKNLFRLDNKSENFSALGNAFALLIGLGNSGIAQKIAEETDVVPVTLSMKTFVYDVLLKTSGNYKKYITEDIIRNYGYMLGNGATTFWETIKGSEDFHGAGSLCHGWSALPIYYFHLFGLAEYEKNGS